MDDGQIDLLSPMYQPIHVTRCKISCLIWKKKWISVWKKSRGHDAFLIRIDSNPSDLRKYRNSKADRRSFRCIVVQQLIKLCHLEYIGSIRFIWIILPPNKWRILFCLFSCVCLYKVLHLNSTDLIHSLWWPNYPLNQCIWNDTVFREIYFLVDCHFTWSSINYIRSNKSK